MTFKNPGIFSSRSLLESRDSLKCWERSEGRSHLIGWTKKISPWISRVSLSFDWLDKKISPEVLREVSHDWSKDGRDLFLTNQSDESETRGTIFDSQNDQEADWMGWLAQSKLIYETSCTGFKHHPSSLKSASLEFVFFEFWSQSLKVFYFFLKKKNF